MRGAGSIDVWKRSSAASFPKQVQVVRPKIDGGRIGTRKAECNVKPLASVAAALAVNGGDLAAGLDARYPTLLGRRAIVLSRFWNFRTQAEQTPSESGFPDSAEESMFDPLMGAWPQLE
jgi:hypothetical protein